MRPHDDGTLTGFHVSRIARDRYQFDQAFFTRHGKAIIASFHIARLFAQRMNQERDLASFPEQAVRASQINAIALIHGITQYVFRLYCSQHDPGLLKDALGRLYDQFGTTAVNETLDRFIAEFPSLPVYTRELDSAAYLSGATAARSNREIALEELLMLWLLNANPAFSPLLELFGDDALEQKTSYPKIISDLYQYFDKVAVLDALTKSSFTGGQNIIEFLLTPVRAAPYSLEGQLVYLLEHWGALIGGLAYWLLRSLDLIKEEHRPAFGGPGPAVVPTFGPELEFERFSADREWMPRLVLIAKNAYVWLDQLSKKYGRAITRLDQIPDEELDMLASWGFTGLWLIGLWERSTASRTIKQRMGNPEAVASAYSLFDYQIAADLGGEAACSDLKRRAWQRGIRLASDMVPNHVGIDSKWVIEHPDWFVALDYSPFPSYRFNGPDLSWDQRVGIHIEDHYYDHSDAAVVFKRVDRWTGSTRYIYHGNDGTSMPWNDTAQLNYLNPEVREAMIQTILHVARQFPVIRFDAAMTLVKKHFHRLWFPEPGSGGAIPSRAEQGMTRAQLDALMPVEFWREVVDRVAVEAPDTLLLAEAFWLMEGYFVRTLGMHRVYNSAFMNMLRDEDNAKYRQVMKNTLEFDPEVLKRYVNFMNNPDERTAVDQFGKEGKYFGICTLMATMPGLPMFGHGQVEGFAEKYGMEFRRAYWGEQPDNSLIQRHEREIFPLLRRRYLFSGVEDFLLYDFFTPEGGVNEGVLAYSNRYGDERTLVVYHNAYATARGWIRTSAAYSVKTGRGDERVLVQRTLGEGLGLQPDRNQFCVFRDHGSGLEYIRNSKDLCEQGLYVELGAYQYHVMLDFRAVIDDVSHQYSNLAAYLGGRGVPNIDEALQELFVRPVREPFKELVNPGVFRSLLAARVTEQGQPLDWVLLDEVEEKFVTLLHAIGRFSYESGGELRPSRVTAGDVTAEDADLVAMLAQKVRARLEASLLLLSPGHPLLAAAAPKEKALKAVQSGLADVAIWGGLLGWLFVHALGELVDEVDSAERSRSWIDEWLLGRVIADTLRELGLDESTAVQTVTAVKLMTSRQHLFEGQADERADQILGTLLRDAEAQQLLRVNRYREVLWFNKEAFDALLLWLLLLPTVTASRDPLHPNSAAVALVSARYRIVEQLRQAASMSDYQTEKLRAAVIEANRPQPATKTRGNKAKTRTRK
jgi:glycosidase